jgi:UDP-N-acetyl-D-glucosamine dehydrogenase
MPRYSVDRLDTALSRKGKAIAGSTVLLLGLAFKGGVSDARNSPTLRVAELLAAEGAVVKVADPWVERFPATPTFDMVELSHEEVSTADAVMLMTDHDQIDYDAVLAAADVVLDCRGKLRHAEVEQL